MSDEIEKQTEYGPLKKGEYDGIQEYDNQLPRWWVWKFILTCIFGVLYFFYYHMSGVGTNLNEDYSQDLREEQLEILVRSKQQEPASQEELQQLMSDNAALDLGQSIYDVNCATCHGSLGEGLIGPNLRDQYWIHGNKLTDIVAIIENGVAAKGMVAWKSLLKREEIHSVAAYVKSLKGSDEDIPNAKGPEGELIPEN